MKKKTGLRRLLGMSFEAQITSMSTRGWGLCDVLLEGREITVEVKDALLGDSIKGQLTHVRSGLFEGRILEKMQSTWDTLKPRCAHALERTDKDTGCGGCRLQALEYADQVELKKRILRIALDKAGLESIAIEDFIPAVDPWYYRNKMELSFGGDGAEGFGLGLHPAGFKYEVINLIHCYLMDENLALLAAAVREKAEELGLSFYHFRRNEGFLRLFTMRVGKRTGQCMLILTTSGEETQEVHGEVLPSKEVVERIVDHVLQLAKSRGITIDAFVWTQWLAIKGKRTRFVDTCMAGNDVLKETLYLPDAEHALHFEILPRAFFQPNSLQAEKLYGLLVELAAPKLKENSRVIDLYCGTGTIALAFAKYGHKVIGVDIEKQAIENAKTNAKSNNLEHAEFFAGDAGEILQALMKERPEIKGSLLVIDPPRRGIMPASYRQILQLQPPTIAYVSCNPESFAHDLSLFVKDGYRIAKLYGVDMLPQTVHIEAVALLEKI